MYAETVSYRVDVAYIYPAPYWSLSEHDWIKSLLLFFDEVAILLPDYMYGRHHVADPSLAEPLEERGMLRVLEPNDWIDEQARVDLVRSMAGLIDSGAFDELDRTAHFEELSQSRAGYNVDIAVADDLVNTLLEMGLARPTADGASVPMHPVVRSTMLVLLGQLARGIGLRRNLAIHPTTAQAGAVRDLERFLLTDSPPSAGRVVTLDCEPVGLNMGPVPLDEMLDFRTEHLPAYKAYMTSLRGFMAEIGDAPASDRDALLLTRRDEIADSARALQRSSRSQLRKNLGSVGLGISGAAWSAAAGDVVGVVLGAGALLAGLGGTRPQDINAYTYLFEASSKFR